MRKQVTWLAALAVFAMACSDSTAPSSRTLLDTHSSAIIPDANPTYPFPSSNGIFPPNPANGDGLVTVCKMSDEAGTFSFSYSVNGGTVQQTSITISAGQVNTRVCAAAPLHNSDLASEDLDEVTVSEDDPGAGWTTTVDVEQHFVQNIVNNNAYHVDYLNDTFDNTARSATVQINDDLEKVVVFTNTAPDDTGGEGCTPGFWKNNADKKAASQWPVPTNTLFSTVFGANDDLPGTTTLLQALNLGGGGINALARHAAAAYLNVVSSGVDYSYTEAELIALVANALSTNNYETAKGLLADANEAGCPIDQNP